MDTRYSKLLLAVFLASISLSCNSNVSETLPVIPERETRVSQSESQASAVKSARPSSKDDRFAVGSRLENPRTPTLEYDALVDATAGTVGIAAFKRYENSFGDYLNGRVNGTRGKLFEAAVAFQANRHLQSAGRPERILTTAAEGDPGHPADNLLWSDNQIRKSYQLKSTRNRKSIASFLSEKQYVDKYDDEIIIVHPETLADIKQNLKNQKLRGKTLPPELAAVETAIAEGRLSDEVIPGLKVPSYDEMHAEADQAIRRQFAYAKSLHGSSAVAARTSEARQNTGNDSQTVYVTTSGKKYHRDDCQYLRKSKHPIPLDEARKSYSPCKRCKPPR